MALLCALLGSAALTASARAATISVDTTVDQNDTVAPCALREAVESINAGADVGGCTHTGADYGTSDTVMLPAGTYELAGSGDNDNSAGDLDLLAPMAITGDPAGGSVIDLGEADRALDVRPEASGTAGLSIDDLVIRNGAPTPDTVGAPADGGAIRMDDPDGALSLDRVEIFDSSATGVGGAITRGDTTSGSVTITDSEFDGNSAVDDGGAIFRPAPTSVGIQMNISGSTFSANTSGEKGGAVYQQGNGSNENEASYTNSTFSGNSASEGGGAIALGNPAPSATLSFVTLADNSTPTASSATGGGAALFGDAVQDLIGLTGTALSHNLSAGVDSACAGPASYSDVGSRGYNIETADTCHLTATTSQVDTDPLLAPLAQNGGPTATRGLYDGSPALDQIPPTGLSTPCQGPGAFDQRGVMRPVGTACDVGAFEGSVGPVPTPPSGGGSPPSSTPSPLPPHAKKKKCKKKKKHHRAAAAKKKCKKKKRK
jgi:predicted outer membrane repeat protein